jgi:hypothetical protein
MSMRLAVAVLALLVCAALAVVAGLTVRSSWSQGGGAGSTATSVGETPSGLEPSDDTHW